MRRPARRTTRLVAGFLMSAAAIGGAVPTIAPPAYASPGCSTTATPSTVVKDHRAAPWSVAMAGLDRLDGIADGTGITVAVLDSGVDAAAARLTGRLDGGIDMLGTTRGLIDCVGHGTAVASIVAAGGKPGSGFRGIAPGARLLPVRVSEAESVDGTVAGAATDAAGLAAAIRRAVIRGARVLNLSLVVATDTTALRDAVAWAIARDVVIVAAVGNGHVPRGADPVPYPAGYPGVIGVGAIGPDGRRLASSEVGSFVDIVAPGGAVTAARLPAGLGSFDGTSFAAPYVAGTAALVWQAWPDLSAAQVTARILGTADPPVDAGGPAAYGHGVVDPYRAVTDVPPESDAGTSPTTSPGTPPSALAGGPPTSPDRLAGTTSLSLMLAGLFLAAAALTAAFIAGTGKTRRAAHGGPHLW